MVFSLASRVSALGDAELVRAVYVPAQLKTYFVYTARAQAGSRQFYARELPPVASLTPSASPVPGPEHIIGSPLTSVKSFYILALSLPGHVMFLYDDGSYVWRFVYDFLTASMVEMPNQLFEGSSPVLSTLLNNVVSAYLKDNSVKIRYDFGAEANLVSPSGKDIVSFSAVARNTYSLNYAGAHSPKNSVATSLSPDANTRLLYILDSKPPTKPVYLDQDLEPGPVSFGPIIPSMDPKGLALTYGTLYPLPPGLSIDPVTGVVSGTLSAVDLSTGTLIVTVTNGAYTIETDGIWLFGSYADGGTRSTYVSGGDYYRIHAFYDSDSFTVNQPIAAEYLVVGGGGGGGMDMGGGGGGGGVVTGSVIIDPGTYQVKVGEGGHGAPGGLEYRRDGIGPQADLHQFTIPATSGNPSSVLGTDYADAYLSLLLNMNGSNNGVVFADASPYKNLLSRFGDVKTTTAQSKFGGSSAVFDGNGDYLSTIPNVMTFATDDFTIEAWIRLSAMPTSDAWPTNFSSHMVVISSGTPSAGDGLGFMVGATKLILQSNDSQIISGNHGMTTNTWYHIAVSRNNTALRLFVNGAVIATTTSAAYLGTGSATYIGSETGQGAWFNGHMNDLRVTRGFCRYAGPFSIPTSQFTYQGGIVAIGGGAGGSSYYPYSPGPRGYDGGSGGGASGYSDGSTRPGGRGLSGQGFSGGQGGGQYYSGGGGGAGGAGANSTAKPNGGPGLINNIMGTSYYWGGGGGGAAYTATAGGDGGLGGGGGGGVGITSGGSGGINLGFPGGRGTNISHANTPGGDGGANTGGGGGGGSHYNRNNRGGNGGSGMAVMRYMVQNPDTPQQTATGGVESTATIGGVNYKIHTFTSSGTLLAKSSLANVEYLIVGGGGGGGKGETNASSDGAGGGGGGGVLTGTVSIPVGVYSITVGSGGAGSTSVSIQGSNGGNSSFATFTAIGGGGGGSDAGSPSGANVGNSGGSGGGAASFTTGGGGESAVLGGAGIVGQGSNGGGSAQSTGTTNRGGGGGGGAGSNGSQNNGNIGGAGGSGISNDISGAAVTYAGGGGGGGGVAGIGGLGGVGGGGSGSQAGTVSAGGNGAPNTGGGGGGSGGGISGSSGNGGAGGSGIVIVRYPV